MIKNSQTHHSMAARRITLWQHHPAEGPGRILRWADQRGIALSCKEAWRGDMGSKDPGDALIVLGGPYSLLTPPQWLADELSELKRVVAQGVPIRNGIKRR